MGVKTRKLTTTAVTAALVYVVTLLLVIQIPAVKGAYFNLGDVIIYCAAYIMGGPYAAVAAAIGSGFADLTVGSTIYIPATVRDRRCFSDASSFRPLQRLIYSAVCAQGKKAAAVFTAHAGGGISSAGCLLLFRHDRAFRRYGNTDAGCRNKSFLLPNHTSGGMLCGKI